MAQNNKLATGSNSSYNKLMLSNPGNFQNLVTRLIIDHHFEAAMKIGAQRYQIKQFKI